MEREIRDELDGTGGGYGRYKGATLREIDSMLKACLQDKSMRGVSAVLRITHEQLDARGGLGSYPWLVVLGLVVGCCLLGASFVVHGEIATKLREFAAQVGAVTLLFGVAVFSMRIARKKSLYQERVIREMATEVLLDIVRDPSFKPKELDRTQRLTLERLLKKAKRPEPELRALLG